MKSYRRFLVPVFSILVLTGWKVSDTTWLREVHKGYTLYYTAADSKLTGDYIHIFEEGIRSARAFFDSSFRSPFNIYIHPHRLSLDSAWQKDWNMPSFKSSCWMVASGVAARMDLLSPAAWEKEACEHIYKNAEKTQQLITHEMIHVYHGQHNESADFSQAEGIDWFVEGLATYASGQCDSMRMAEVKNAITTNKIPASLDQFWTGKLKYGLSGSVVMWIDNTYGRAKLNELIRFKSKKDLLAKLNLSESALLEGWKDFMLHK